VTRWLVVGFIVGLVVVGGAATALTGGEPTSNDIPLQPTNGPTITVTNHGGQLELTDPFNETGKLYLSQVTDTANATFTGSGAGTVDLTEVEGTWTNVTSLAVSGAPLTINASDKPPVTVSGSPDRVAIRQGMAIGDGQPDLVYEGTSGTTTLELRGLAPNTDFIINDNGTPVGTGTTDASGSVTLSGLSNSKHVITLSSQAPTTLSNPAPTGGLATDPSQLSVQVNDSNTGEDIDVEFKLDGTSEGTTTIQANGTATVSISNPKSLVGGQHTVEAIATDESGRTFTTTYSFRVPAKIDIFEEQRPAVPVDDVNVTLTFFETSNPDSDGAVFERQNDSAGTLNLTGLPVQRDMTVVAEAPGYATRRIYLDDIYEQQEIYLLNTSLGTTTGDVVFELRDQTGEFPDRATTLRVQRALQKDFDGDGTNETRMQTIAGDKFGATGEFPATLEVNSTRYRLIVTNEQGDRRVLGSYQATSDDRAVLEVGQVTFGADEVAEGTAFSAQLTERGGQRVVVVEYRDPSRQTTNISYQVNRTNSNSVLVANTTQTGPFGTFTATHALPANAPDEVGYEITFHANRTNATDVGDTRFTGDLPEIATNLNIDPSVLSLFSYVTIVAIMGLVVVFDDRLAAIAGTATAALLTFLGAVSIPPVAVGIAGTIAIMYNVARIR
jgi:hypothetical protein